MQYKTYLPPVVSQLRAYEPKTERERSTFTRPPGGEERDGNGGRRRHARRGACAVGSPLVSREGEGFELHRIPSTSIDQASRAAPSRAPNSDSCQPPKNSATPRLPEPKTLQFPTRVASVSPSCARFGATRCPCFARARDVT